MSGILWRVSVNLVRLDELEAWDHAVRRLLRVPGAARRVPPLLERRGPRAAAPPGGRAVQRRRLSMREIVVCQASRRRAMRAE